VLTISLTASRDGAPLEDATADDLEYTVGSGQMLEGLDEAVTGLSAGESATFSSTLVGGPLKDEPADIEVTVTKVQVQELPEADDDFAQQASEFDTFEELRANISERLTQMARLEQASQARDAVLEALLETVDVEVPENLLNGELEARREQITSQLAQAQLSLEQYLTDAEDDQTEDEFWADVETRAVQGIKAQMILDKIAEERQVSVDQNDLTQHIIRKAQQDNVPPQQVADHLQEHPHHIDEYMTEIRRGKALALLVESATVTDSDGNPIDLAHLREDGSLSDPNLAPEGEEANAGGDLADESGADESGATGVEESKA
jgi:trigger factor